MVEMVLKVVVYGFNNYWRSAQNRFDFVITVTIGESLLCKNGDSFTVLYVHSC